MGEEMKKPDFSPKKVVFWSAKTLSKTGQGKSKKSQRRYHQRSRCYYCIRYQKLYFSRDQKP